MVLSFIKALSSGFAVSFKTTLISLIILDKYPLGRNLEYECFLHTRWGWHQMNGDWRVPIPQNLILGSLSPVQLWRLQFLEWSVIRFMEVS